MKDKENTVFVLGGGRTGLTAVRDLAATRGVDRVVVGDVETSRAEKLAASIGANKIAVTKVDLTNQDELVATIKQSKVLINATWYEYNVDVLNAAIQAGVHYLDMGGLFHVTRKQMQLDERAKEAQVTAVLGAGESPGITNVMCAASRDEMDFVEDVRIRVGGREAGPGKPGELVFPFAVSTVFDEYSKPPIMFLEGTFQQVEPLSGSEEVRFAEPVGKQMCHYSIHSEVATLPLTFKGVRNVDFKLGISETIYQSIKPLIDCGMADASPIEVKGYSISPREFAVALLTARSANIEPSRYVALRTEVTGTRKEKHVCQIRELIGAPSQSFGVMNATALLTGIGASITAQLIMNKEITQIGVMAPETCIPVSRLIQELAARKITMTTVEKEL